jgi:hypothetical protein
VLVKNKKGFSRKIGKVESLPSRVRSSDPIPQWKTAPKCGLLIAKPIINSRRSARRTLLGGGFHDNGSVGSGITRCSLGICEKTT